MRKRGVEPTWLYISGFPLLSAGREGYAEASTTT